MSGLKKINLLPIEIKKKYANRYLKYIAYLAFVIMLLAILFQAAESGILLLQIKHINDKNAKYEELKTEIENLESESKAYSAFIEEYEKRFIPFERFMNNLEDIRPESVHIISVDTPDRLVNEGTKDEEKKEDTNSDNDLEEDKKGEEQETESKSEIAYTDDLAGKNIIIRGYGKKQDDISVFIYELSKLPYVVKAEITAIEEHEMYDGQRYNIFEIVVQGGTSVEADIEG